MGIRIDDLKGPEILDLLNEHLRDMHAVSPPESVHALDIAALQKPEITIWTAWKGGKLAGCGAIKELNANEGEIKSMRTAGEFRRKGVAAGMLKHILAEALRRKYKTLYLETGSMEFFRPALLNATKWLGRRSRYSRRSPESLCRSPTAQKLQRYFNYWISSACQPTTPNPQTSSSP